MGPTFLYGYSKKPPHLVTFYDYWHIGYFSTLFLKCDKVTSGLWSGKADINLADIKQKAYSYVNDKIYDLRHEYKKVRIRYCVLASSADGL